MCMAVQDITGIYSIDFGMTACIQMWCQLKVHFCMQDLCRSGSSLPCMYLTSVSMLSPVSSPLANLVAHVKQDSWLDKLKDLRLPLPQLQHSSYLCAAFLLSCCDPPVGPSMRQVMPIASPKTQTTSRPPDANLVSTSSIRRHFLRNCT